VQQLVTLPSRWLRGRDAALNPHGR
jgi:hypothetical protein